MNKNEVVEEHYVANHDRLVNSLVNVMNKGDRASAEDIVHETYSKCLKYFKAYNKEKEFSKWFNRILRNTIREFKNNALGIDRDKFWWECMNKMSIGRDSVTNPMMCSLITDSINKKREDYQEVLYLFFVQEFKPREIAQIVKVTPTNIRQVIRRFKLEMWDEYGVDV